MRSDGREELLYDSDRTRVARIRSADGARVVRKQPLGSGAAARLGNELAILRHLAGVDGIPRLAPGTWPEGTLELVDADSRTLAERPTPWSTGPLIEVAHALAEVLAAVHRNGVIHRDVSPANVLLAEDGTPTLIDFELATLSAQNRSADVPEDGLAGTLPYLAPEQTGRTGRPVDHRADLYALGATLYELATGDPPFGRDRDPLGLIHDHLAKVPVPPGEVNPEVPAVLSEIIMRLLRKEPDQRYQSGEGLAYDLALLHDCHLHGLAAVFTLGARDFPIRLAPPARLIGRDAPMAALHGLLAEVTGGRSALAMITGPSGVGKTALVDRLRPAVAAAGGRFVTGKFDQYRHDLGGDAIREAFDQLGTQLLAEPDEVVTVLRARLREALGPDAGLIAYMMPPVQALLDVPAEQPEDEEPRVVFARVRHAGLTLLRTVATVASPVVFFVDDLQWASGPAFAFFDDLLGRGDLPGLLVLGAYREEEVDETHPLSSVLARLRRDRGEAAEVRLANLGPEHLEVLAAEMLRLPVERAAPLARVLAERTGGNPFDTVELINALRRETVLVPEGAGWRWDESAVRRFVGHGDVVGLISARIEALPEDTRELVGLIACLGSEVDLSMLRVASGWTDAEIHTALLPAADDGLLSIAPTAVCFRHDRVHQAAYGRLEPAARTRVSLVVARRLAADPEFAVAAAPLYLTAVDLLAEPGATAPGERLVGASSLRKAAAAARLVANHVAGELYLAATLRVLGPTDFGYDEVRAEWHAALCGLGRFDEADAVFADLSAGDHDALWLAGPLTAHIGGLAKRGRFAEAITLGLDMMTRLGVDVPAPPEMGPRIGAGMGIFYRWLATSAEGREHTELTDPTMGAVTQVIKSLMPVTFLSDKQTMAWLVVHAAGMWAEQGISAVMTGIVGNLGLITIAGGGAHGAAYQAVREVLATGEKYGYEPETSLVKFLHSLGTIYWFEPLETSIRQVHEARDGLLRAGDTYTALYTFFASVPQTLDSGDLEAFDQEARAGAAFCERTGAGYDAAVFGSAQRLVRAMHGEFARPGTLGDTDFDEDAYLEEISRNEPAIVYFSVWRALAAAVYGDGDGLDRHISRAIPILPVLPGAYTHAPAHLLAALGAAGRARGRTGAEREAALADLDRSRDFLAARAADQPGNFRHMHRFTEALRAAAHDDFAAAAAAFDAAMADATSAGRAWHVPLITERAAAFYLDNGLDHVGNRLLAEALAGYARWGATGKVHDLKRTHPALAATLAGVSAPRATTVGGNHSINLSTEVIDLMAVLEAARALSSEKKLDDLRVRVQHVLSQMTGATAVHVVLWDERAAVWVLPGDAGRPELDVAEAARQGLLPLTAIRYAERTREPMLVDDVSLDDRVARDPYVAWLEHCSLLVVPVISQGQPRAILLLENRLTRRAFSVSRLDAVQLIAGQLTVSLENAQVYANLERTVAERTEELNEANHRLEMLTVTDPLTGLPNRRKLTSFLETEWLRSIRSNDPIGLAMIDIDNFKKYNDHYGHQGGDECLKLVAESLRNSVRVTDLVARYGGEEFCIVMPGATQENAMIVAERACRAVAAMEEPHQLTETGIVTISVGVTSGSPSTAAGPDQLTKLADEALYQAKRGGRNRVVGG
ncbi:diguanylate cyclase [Actinoplanes sp. NPDC051851]|uniref:diguanylate cyclase n=1 Tax=Actinoplanes sp. NPDC051851 TaxID=3154753 RepID=UPI0034340E10